MANITIIRKATPKVGICCWPVSEPSRRGVLLCSSVISVLAFGPLFRSYPTLAAALLFTNFLGASVAEAIARRCRVLRRARSQGNSNSHWVLFGGERQGASSLPQDGLRQLDRCSWLQPGLVS